jgi:hypothetical protein
MTLAGAIAALLAGIFVALVEKLNIPGFALAAWQ